MKLKIKTNLSNFLKKVEKLYTVAVSTLMLVLLNSSIVSAEPDIITGTKDLFSDITKWLLILIPLGIGAFVGFQALQKGMTEDQAEIAHKNKVIKNSIIGGILAVSASGLINLILGYYK